MAKQPIADVTLDQILGDPKAHKSKVFWLDNLVIDRKLDTQENIPFVFMVHQEGGEKTGIVFAYHDAAAAASFSDPGQKIKVAGKFEKDGNGWHFNVYKLENYSFPGLVT